MPANARSSSPRADLMPTPRERFGRWVAEHDDSWLFTGLYVGLALLLSTVISLFWLVVVVAAHGVLEWFALSHRGVRDRRLGRVLWHLKLDAGLVLVALALGLYFEVLSADPAVPTDHAAPVAPTAPAATAAPGPLPWARPWPLGDRVAVALTVAFAALVLLAPLLTDHTAVTAWTTVVAELHPWPGG